MKKLVVVLAVALGLVACGSSNKEPATPESHGEHHHDGSPATATAKDGLKKPGEAKPGDKSTCTVTGEEIDVTADSPHSEHEGKTYYFCCTGCKKKFDADPSKFTKS